MVWYVRWREGGRRRRVGAGGGVEIGINIEVEVQLPLSRAVAYIGLFWLWVGGPPDTPFPISPIARLPLSVFAIPLPV